MVHMHSLKGMLCLGLSLSMLVVSSATVALADVNGVYQPMDGNNTWNNTSSAYSGFNNPGYSASSNAGGFTNPVMTAEQNPLALRARVATIPDGTTLMVSLDAPVNSLSATIGDPVTGKIENDVYVNDTVVIPQGSEVIGQVASVSKSGHVGKHGAIDIKFFSAKTPQGTMIPLRAMIATKDDTGILKGNTYAMDIAKGVGITALGTGAGAGMGVAAGSLLGAAGAGALFGLGVGALAGGGYALARKGQDVILPRGARLTLTTTQATTVSPN